jgi:hypothetical protein
MKKTIPGFPDYMADSKGNIYGKNGERLSPSEDSDGYLKVNLVVKDGIETMRVHSLVLLAFKGLPGQKSNQARHLDGNKKNNALSNLSWGSYTENNRDKIRHGTSGKDKTKKELVAQAQEQINNCIKTIEAQKHKPGEFDLLNPWVNRTADGRFGNGQSNENNAVNKASKEIENLLLKCKDALSNRAERAKKLKELNERSEQVNEEKRQVAESRATFEDIKSDLEVLKSDEKLSPPVA